MIANPRIEEGLAISSVELARGLGDCGELSRWVWQDDAMRLVTHASMPFCRGIPSTYWPRRLDLAYQP